jgi:hypothetical protein
LSITADDGILHREWQQDFLKPAGARKENLLCPYLLSLKKNNGHRPAFRATAAKAIQALSIHSHSCMPVLAGSREIFIFRIDLITVIYLR